VEAWAAVVDGELGKLITSPFKPDGVEVELDVDPVLELLDVVELPEAAELLALPSDS
jgi:hypothetical protein